MAWTTEEKLRLAEILVALQISRSVMNRLLGGKITRAENQVMKALLRTSGRIAAAEGRGLGRLAARGVPALVRGVGFAARTNPYSFAAGLAIAGYIKREEIAEVARAVADDPRVAEAYEGVIERGQAALGTAREAAIHTYGPDLSGLSGARGLARRLQGKRKPSRANKAVKQAMTWLKRGGPSTTGAAKGRLPTKAFTLAVKAAGLANPKTKSKPGKGKSKINKLARRLKKWW
jgi:hypothetical protein